MKRIRAVFNKSFIGDLNKVVRIAADYTKSAKRWHRSMTKDWAYTMLFTKVTVS